LIKSLTKDYKIAVLCLVFEVSRQSYYNYVGGRSYNSHLKYNRPRHEIRLEFIKNRKRYGVRRIQAAIAKGAAIKLSKQTIGKIMKEEGLKAIQPRSFVPRTTDSKHGKRVCENLLLNQPAPTAPNQVWVSDITYMPLKGGQWCYLAAWQDKFTKEIVGWQLADNMREEIVREPLEKALLKRKIKGSDAIKPLIIHSDRGGQYLSDKMKELVKTFEIKQSMSRADDPYDNAQAESLWSRLKAELEIPKGGYESIKDLRSILFEYIEAYYNRVRLHSSIGYMSPVSFIENFYKKVG
jgi:putative transposase